MYIIEKFNSCNFFVLQSAQNSEICCFTVYYVRSPQALLIPIFVYGTLYPIWLKLSLSSLKVLHCWCHHTHTYTSTWILGCCLQIVINWFIWVSFNIYSLERCIPSGLNSVFLLWTFRTIDVTTPKHIHET